MQAKLKKHMSSAQIILLGFAGVILIGALLLMLPFSSQSGSWTHFWDALFTSVSAVCVTGLVVVDTATHWSCFGEAVILLLIQIGGLGVITVALAVFIASGRKIGLAQRSVMQEAISAHKLGGIVRLTGFILKATFVIELIGAFVMMFVFVPEFGMRGVWISIFHSVSAFCNAGFDLMGSKGEFSSLESYSANPVVSITIMLLIIAGGVGFLVWDDLRTNKFNIKKYRMQTKVVLLVTAVLILLPAWYFYAAEFSELPRGERVLSSFFQSITTRTAGFNTQDFASFTGVGTAISIVLMLIGGSPGSTAGGMKTTTAAVMILSAISIFRQKSDVECFGRRIGEEAVRNAAALMIMYIVLFFGCAAIISALEDVSMRDCLFETASAIGTVGLSHSLTPSLGRVSQALLMCLMFFGRVGGLNIIFATVTSGRVATQRKPLEKIIVG